MNETLLKTLLSLKKTLNEDKRVIALNEIEAKLNEDEQVIKLAIAFHQAQTTYNDMLSYFHEESEEVKKAQAKLYECKKALDENEQVAHYNKAYIKVRKMYEQINATLFDPFKTNFGKCSKFSD